MSRRCCDVVAHHSPPHHLCPPTLPHHVNHLSFTVCHRCPPPSRSHLSPLLPLRVQLWRPAHLAAASVGDVRLHHPPPLPSLHHHRLPLLLRRRRYHRALPAPPLPPLPPPQPLPPQPPHQPPLPHPPPPPSPSPTLDLSTPESYTLTIPLQGPATLTSPTLYGALRGLETFAQLLRFDFPSSTYTLPLSPWHIVDAPRFPHRGLLVDVSRHFHPLSALRRMVDAMSYAKLNVLHLHLSDTEAFPLHSAALPLLSTAAWSPLERYSVEDLAELAEYARLRGVRVMGEIDMPGHAASWCVGYPELCPSATCQQPLDPSNERTFTVIRQLMEELTSALPYSLFHVGGDEVDVSCWTQVPHVQQWMASRNYTALDALLYFTTRVQAIARSLQRTPVTWDEVYQEFGTRLPHDTIIHVWRLTQLHVNATNDGFRTILSVTIPWYLDGAYLWQMQYATDPWDGLVPAQRALVLGGETCLWSEEVDSGDLFNTVWPRAAAVAEKLWSAWEVDDVLAAEPRFAWFRCHLNRRGVGASPYLIPFRTAPAGPGACLAQ